jgi:hypothetical protein
VLRKSPLECIIASIKCAQISEKLLRVRTPGKKFFFYAGAAEMSSSRVAGHIQDDTDLNRDLNHD